MTEHRKPALPLYFDTFDGNLDPKPFEYGRVVHARTKVSCWMAWRRGENKWQGRDFYGDHAWHHAIAYANGVDVAYGLASS